MALLSCQRIHVSAASQYSFLGCVTAIVQFSNWPVSANGPKAEQRTEQSSGNEVGDLHPQRSGELFNHLQGRFTRLFGEKSVDLGMRHIGHFRQFALGEVSALDFASQVASDFLCGSRSHVLRY